MDEFTLIMKQQKLEELRNLIGDCRRCKLHKTRTNIVFGEGNPAARIIFIGEGPGRDEDAQGRPFVGRAGQLLTAIIEKGMLINRSEVYIANIVKCRPTENLAFVKDRPPDDEEREACGGFLIEQIDIINPDVIITLGNPATQFLLKTRQGITKARGTWFSYKGIPVMPTYHPSYILRNGDEASPLKREVWEDIKMVLEKLNNAEMDQSAQSRNMNEKEIYPEKSVEVKEKEIQGKLF